MDEVVADRVGRSLAEDRAAGVARDEPGEGEDDEDDPEQDRDRDEKRRRMNWITAGGHPAPVSGW